MSDLPKIIHPDEVIMDKIYLLRGKKVMLDVDLAKLYNVETRVLKQAVRRNINRFPEDFMFELSQEEYQVIRIKDGMLKRGEHSKYIPFAFTEQGVAMLSSVLKSELAIMVNIQIMRVFTKMHELAETHKEILQKLEQLEKKDIDHDQKIMLIFEYLKQLEQIKHQELERKPTVVKGYKKEKE